MNNPRCKAIRIAKRPWIGPGFITSSESGEVQIGAAWMPGRNPIEPDGQDARTPGGRGPAWRLRLRSSGSFASSFGGAGRMPSISMATLDLKEMNEANRACFPQFGI